MGKNSVLEKKRIAMGLSYLEMSKRLGISKVYYWQLENNTRRLYYDLAYKIANILEVSTDELFAHEVKTK